MRSVGRTALVVALLPWVAFSLVIPPAHVHEIDAHHSHVVTHRHFEAHHEEGAEFEEGAGHVVWMDNAVDVALAYQLHVPPALAVDVFESVPTTGFWSVTAIDAAAPPHGPPRHVLSVRGPPHLPHLI
jgi:hypothetical protein